MRLLRNTCYLICATLALRLFACNDLPTASAPSPPTPAPAFFDHAPAPPSPTASAFATLRRPAPLWRGFSAGTSTG